MKSIVLGDILAPNDIERAKKVYALYQEGKHAGDMEGNRLTYNQWVSEELIAPRLKLINKATGQENDARYLGYAVEYWMMRERTGR